MNYTEASQQLVNLSDLLVYAAATSSNELCIAVPSSSYSYCSVNLIAIELCRVKKVNSWRVVVTR